MKRNVGVLALVFMVVIRQQGHGQVYPHWFLFPDAIPCAGCASGVAPIPYYPDSTGGQAYAEALANAARAERVVVNGVSAYGRSAAGTVALSTSIHETYDTSSVERLASETVLLDVASNGTVAFALLGPRGCMLSAGMKKLEPVASTPPAWLTTLPVEDGFMYAVGTCEGAYYESSSWALAERRARFVLAKSRQAKVRAVSKFYEESTGMSSCSGVSDETVDAVLSGVQIVRRWRNGSIAAVLAKVRN